MYFLFSGIAIGWLSAVIYALITLVAILLLHGVRTVTMF